MTTLRLPVKFAQNHLFYTYGPEPDDFPMHRMVKFMVPLSGYGPFHRSNRLNQINMRTIISSVIMIMLLSCGQGKQEKATSGATEKEGAVMYHNGDILTMAGDSAAYAEAIVVKDGRILFVGRMDEAMKAAGPGHSMVDLKGGTLIPGFIDGHSHLTNYADATLQADLNPPPIGKVESISDIIATVKSLKEKTGAGDTGILIGYGYDADMLKEKRHPNAADLDAAFPNNPVILKHASGHMLVANSVAMKMAGISAATPDPQGGTIIRKKGSQEPDGLVQEQAMMAFVPMMNKPLAWEVEMKKLKDAQDHYASSGVTTAAEHLAIPDKVVLLEKAAAEKRIYIDLMVTPGFMMAKEVLGTGRIKWREYSNHLNFVGLKMAVDGSPQGKTAFLTKPYLTPVPGCTKDCRGFSNMTQEQVDQLMLACYKNNVQLYSHCNGDASIDMMIKGHENAVKVLGDSTTDRRTVIIHSQIMRPDQLEKYKKYHMIPSFFTNHTYYWGDVHLANLGKERGGYISPMRAAIDKGVIATNHTDFIVTPLDQLFLLWTSVNRLSRTGQPVGEGQRITPYEGLRALTAYGAYEYFEEKSKGTLEAGKIADLVILDKNPLKVDPAAIRDIKVVETIKEGKTIYRK